MRIKRFDAETMPEALAQVRAEMGPDAVILNTRSVRRDSGLLGLLAKPRVEVTAAIDVEPGAPVAGKAPRAGRVAPDDSWRTLQLSRAVVAPLEEELRELRLALEGSRVSTASEPTLAVEVAELRRLARAMAAQVGEPEAGSAVASYRAAGLSPGLSCELGAGAEQRMADGAESEQALVDALADRLAPKLGPPRADVGHQLVVGSPGVGKTTSVAKQAGLILDPHTRIVSTDVHRLGGSDGLRSISECLGVRFDEVATPEALARLASAPRHRMLVDTAGGGRSDGRSLSDLALFRRALGARAEVQVVLSATTKECDLRRQIARYRFLEPHSVVVTKVDESGELGNVVNVLLEQDTPQLAWIGSGQHVPEDFEAPNPHELARRVMEASP